MKFNIDKQGTELEFHMVDSALPTREFDNLHSIVTDLVHDVSDHYHTDDSKIEFSSAPYVTLGSMEEHLVGNVSGGLDMMKKYGNPILLGCLSFHQDFASAHVHTSVKGMKRTTWLELRRKLYNAQPIIALLSQNSPIVNGFRAGDVRLALSRWSRFTDWDSANQDHWMSLAYGMEGSTLEVRLPSAGPLQQVLAVMALIRVVLSEDTEPYSVSNIMDNFNNVVNYGSSSLTKVSLPRGVTFHGIERKSVHVLTCDLWKSFYEENKQQFDEVLSSVSAGMRKNINEFYEFVASGHTLSDSVMELITANKDDKEACEQLSNATLKSYRGYDVFDYLNKAPKKFMPTIESYISLADFKEIVDKLVKIPSQTRLEGTSQDFLDLILRRHGMMSNTYAVQMFKHLNNYGFIYKNDYPSVNQKLLEKLDILKADGDKMQIGTKFIVAVQLIKECGLI